MSPDEAFITKIAIAMRTDHYRHFTPYKPMIPFEQIGEHRRESWLRAARVAVEFLRAAGTKVD